MSKAIEDGLSSISVFLDCLELSKDLVVKEPMSLPTVRRGSDLDIYSIRPDRLIEKIVEATLGRRNELVRVYSVEKDHVQIDIRDERGLVVKFDIYSSFPKYGRFSIRESLFFEIVSSGALAKKAKGIEYPVPLKRHNAFIRYIEYCEFFWIGPDKTHHLDWILSEVSSMERGELFEDLHRNILPLKHEEVSAESNGLQVPSVLNRVLVKVSLTFRRWRDNLYRSVVRPLVR